MSQSFNCKTKTHINKFTSLSVFKIKNFSSDLLNVLHTHSWQNWIDEDDDEVGLKEKPLDTRYIKKITSK